MSTNRVEPEQVVLESRLHTEFRAMAAEVQAKLQLDHEEFHHQVYEAVYRDGQRYPRRISLVHFRSMLAGRGGFPDGVLNTIESGICHLWAVHCRRPR